MNRDVLLAALKAAAPALGDDGAALPALSHYCFEGDSLYAFNDVVAVIVGLKTDLTLGLHGSTLLGVVGALRAETVEFKQKGKIVTLSGAGRVELPALGKEDFVFQMDDVNPIMTASIGPDIKRALEICLISVAEDSMRPEYNGVTLRIGKTGTLLFSTDNVSASRMEPKGAKVPGRKEAALVLPKVAVDLILKLFPSEGLPKIIIGDKLAVVEFGGNPEVTLVTKLLGTPSTKLNEVFEEHVDATAGCVIPEGLEAEINKAKVLTSRENLKECTLSAEKGSLTISVDATLGKMKAVLPIDDKKMEGSVTVDPTFVSRILPHASLLSINSGRSLVFMAEGMAHIVSAVPRAQSVEESK